MAVNSPDFLFGIQIDGKSILSGTGAPPGTVGTPTGDAVIGSEYTDLASGILYQKTVSTNSPSDWGSTMTAAEVNAAILAALLGDSYLDPVLVKDGTLYADVTAAQTAANVGDTVDGVTISAGDDILLSNLTAGVEGPYVVSGSTGAWTFTLRADADPNPSIGDSLIVTDGTDAGTWQYFNNASEWVEAPASLAGVLTEQANIRAFIGKTGSGVELPTFTAGKQIAAPTTTNLEQAIDELNIYLGADVTTDSIITNTNDVKANLEALSAAIQSGSVTEYTALNVTATTIVDSVLVDDVGKIEWEVYAQDVTNTDRTVVATVIVHHDGRAGADATDFAPQIGWTKKTSAKIAGLDFTVTMTGTGAAQAINLTAASTGGIDVRAIRQASISPF